MPTRFLRSCWFMTSFKLIQYYIHWQDISYHYCVVGSLLPYPKSMLPANASGTKPVTFKAGSFWSWEWKWILFFKTFRGWTPRPVCKGVFHTPRTWEFFLKGIHPNKEKPSHHQGHSILWQWGLFTMGLKISNEIFM